MWRQFLITAARVDVDLRCEFVCIALSTELTNGMTRKESRLRAYKGAEVALNHSRTCATFVMQVASTCASSQTRQLASVETPMQIEQTRVGLLHQPQFGRFVRC